jgi:hypothetical protein
MDKKSRNLLTFFWLTSGSKEQREYKQGLVFTYFFFVPVASICLVIWLAFSGIASLSQYVAAKFNEPAKLAADERGRLIFNIAAKQNFNSSAIQQATKEKFLILTNGYLLWNDDGNGSLLPEDSSKAINVQYVTSEDLAAMQEQARKNNAAMEKYQSTLSNWTNINEAPPGGPVAMRSPRGSIEIETCPMNALESQGTFKIQNYSCDQEKAGQGKCRWSGQTFHFRRASVQVYRGCDAGLLLNYCDHTVKPTNQCSDAS